MNQKRRVRANRKEEILECFGRLVAERGYDEVSLRDIASELDISKGTILHHYGSKDQMLERVHGEYMARRLAEAKLILDQVDTPQARLSAIIHQMMIGVAEDWTDTVAFAREIVRFAADETMSEVRGMRREYARIVTGVIREGIDQGVFIKADPRITTLQIFGMCNWAWTWYEPGGDWTPEEVASQYVETLLSGLLTEPAEPSDLKAAMDGIPELVRNAMESVAESEEE